MDNQIERNEIYLRKKYSWMQVRDCIEGSDAVKRKKELYLPMPSGMNLINYPAQTKQNQHVDGFNPMDAPFYHVNPAYKAYLQRATFPDFTGGILRGLSGVALLKEPEISMSSELKNIKSTDAKNLLNIFKHLFLEVCQVGKACMVVDVVESSGEFRISLFSTERNIDWEESVIDGEIVLTKATFIEQFAKDGEGEVVIEYTLIDNIAFYQRYIDGEPSGDLTELLYKGKMIDRLPVFFAGSVDNSPKPDDVPMLGISDSALAFYRKDADLSQAHFLTCNPTLFIFGINEEQKPTLVGSQVVVGISDPAASADYPKTDTSALNHIQEVKRDIQNSAVGMGIQLISSGKKGAESAEALEIRKATGGVSIIDFVKNAGSCIESALNFINIWKGSSESVVFEPSTSFAETKLTAQEITAIVSSWVQGAISQDTLLDKFRDSNIIKGDVTNKQEKRRILKEQEENFPVPEIEEKEDE